MCGTPGWPWRMTIKSGDTITFKNDDPVNHNVFSETKGLEFSLKSQKPGESDTVTLNGEVVNEVPLDHPRLKDRPASGHIGFQDHGLPLWLRNIKVREL